MNEPSVLTRMRLSCCWGDNLNEKELNEVVDYINHLQRENKKLQQERDKYKSIVEETKEYIEKCNKDEGLSMYVDTWQHLLPILNKIKELEEGEDNETNTK